MATNIDDLPNPDSNTMDSKPVQNVKFNIEENNVAQSSNSNPSGVQPSNSTVQLSPDDVNKIISGIQQASQSKLTALPARDIPTQQTQHTMDEEALNPNFVPQKSKEDYIQNHSNYESVLKQQYEAKQKQTKQDELFDELQTPIMISILFFIFQLPVVRKYMFMYLPNLFLKDGNLALSGILVKSLVFGVVYYGCTRLVDYMSVV
jgi:hypothetical protein